METLNRKVQFEINCKDHDEIVLIGKSADFTFNPNTRNGKELFDFLSCCEEIQTYTKEDIENAYRAGENKQTYYLKDTTVILPDAYEGIDG